MLKNDVYYTSIGFSATSQSQCTSAWLRLQSFYQGLLDKMLLAPASVSASEDG